NEQTSTPSAVVVPSTIARISSSQSRAWVASWATSWTNAASRRRRSVRTMPPGAGSPGAATPSRVLDIGPADRTLGHRDESVGHDAGRQAATVEQLVERLEARDDRQDIGRLVDRDAFPQVALLGEAAGDLRLPGPPAVLDRPDRRDRVGIDRRHGEHRPG